MFEKIFPPFQIFLPRFKQNETAWDFFVPLPSYMFLWSEGFLFKIDTSIDDFCTKGQRKWQERTNQND